MQGKDFGDSIARELVRAVTALGANFDDAVLAATRSLYQPHVRPASSDVRVVEDNAYGSGPRHKLDLFRPPGSNLPIVLYVHGGGFVAGDKRGGANVGHYFAGHGFLAAAMTYRLAPGAGWPAGVQDVAAAVEWIVANAAGHGGDPAQLFLLAQSAGASHAASYLFDPDFQPRASQTIRAAALMSGVYQLKAPLRAGTLAYFGDDGATYARRAPLNHVASSRVPVLLTVTQFDPGRIAWHTPELAAEITRQRGACPRFVWLEGHNHVSTVMSLGTPQDDVGRLLVNYLRNASAIT